jgi:hypothetical protein
MKSKLLSLLVTSLLLVVLLPLRMFSQNTCPVPANLSVANIGTNTATLNWLSPSGSSAFLVQYRPVTNPESVWINVTSQSNSISLAGLACGTTYQWHVAGYCNTSTTPVGPYSATVSFATNACTANCIPPAGLTTTNINFTSATFSWVSAASALGYIVQYRPISTPESAWNNVSTQTNSITVTNLTCGNQYQWHVASYCGSSATNISPYSAIAGFNTITCTPSCTAPSGLATTNISTGTATLGWSASAGAIAYLVQYRPVTTPESAWINLTSQSASINISNLQCGIQYQWHVAAYCGTSANNLSPYSAIAGFTTTACTTCLVPTGLATTNVSATGATFSWMDLAGSAGYVVRYRPVTSPESVWTNVSTQNSTITISGLACGKQYQWQVARYCGTATGSISPYSEMIVFNTTACTTNCLPPGGLTATSITSTGAVLSWLAAAPSYAYVVQYRPVTSPESAWTTVTTQTSSVTLTNLLCGKSYQWHVAASCGNNSTTISPYSATADFMTSACVAVCVSPASLSTSNVTASGVSVSWGQTVGALGYVIQYRPITIPESAWININIPNAATSYLLSNLACGKQYQWHVAAYCGSQAGSLSPYSATALFTTLPCTNNVCPVPSGLTSSGLNTGIGGRLLAWNATGAPVYNIRYRVAGTVAWSTATSTSNSKLITGLIALTQYEWQVQSVCSNTTGAAAVSGWSASAFFETPFARTAFPNPVMGNNIHIPVLIDNESRVNIILTDQAGKVVQTTNRTIRPGGQLIDIDVARLKSGVYFLHMQGNGIHEKQKIIIDR